MQGGGTGLTLRAMSLPLPYLPYSQSSGLIASGRPGYGSLLNLGEHRSVATAGGM